MVTLSVLVLAATIGVCMGWGPALSFFPETTLLQCMVPNPRYGETDQPATKVEEIPVIPFHIVYDPAVPGTWFQPLVSSVARSPVAGEFASETRDVLLSFIENEVNIQLSATGADIPRFDPLNPEADAASLIPQRIRLDGDGIGPIVETLQNHTDEVDDRLDELGITDAGTRLAVINAHLALNLRCNVRPMWTRLPIGQFFPEWIYASYCTGAPCSLPGGLSCEPVVKAEAIAHTTFLRWDCCFSLINRRWEWRCGWRKVRLAYIGRCDCSCGIQFVGPGFGYNAGVAQPSVLTD